MTHAVPTREDGLRRLEEFLPLAGRDYAELRNYVPGVVSGLAPYIRNRLLTEEEIPRAVLQRYSYEAAEKFLQEVCWRTYWKGWLEMRPSVWFRYLEDLHSRNGTFLNGDRVEPQRYYELLEQDTFRFGSSTREYVLLHDKSAASPAGRE